MTIDDYEVVPQNSEDSLKKAVAHQPVSAAIDANSDAFQFYQKVNFCRFHLCAKKTFSSYIYEYEYEHYFYLL